MLLPSNTGTTRAMRIKFSSIILTVLIIFLSQPAMAKLYKWVDADGNTHYTDKLPPSQTKKPRTELNEQGIEVKKVGRAKSAEEIAQEQELERLRIEREKIIEKQKAEDRVLLRTFRSEDDIVMAQDGKLIAIDVMIDIATSNIKQSKSQLLNMQNNAASLEKRGVKPSTKLLNHISSTRQQLKDSYATIINREKDKDRIRSKTQVDLKRFRELKKLQSGQAPAKQKKVVTSQLDYVVPCPDTKTCDIYWEKAKQYSLKHATTKIKILAESVLLTAPPNEDDDISITLSRIPKKINRGEHLFFDLQCRTSKVGQKFCGSRKISSIRSGFRKLLLGEEYIRRQ